MDFRSCERLTEESISLRNKGKKALRISLIPTFGYHESTKGNLKQILLCVCVCVCEGGGMGD